MHTNSLEAYNAEIAKFNRREKRVYDLLVSAHPRAFTARQIKDMLYGPLGDMNLVAPRVTKLKDEGWLDEVGSVKSETTGRTVGTFRAVLASERVKRDATKREQMEMAI